ncbi:MAG: carbohydrate kinase family protein [Lachnospiraceae bacterium]|nr:carbohydrate kinase family protein [Lachnospiraceae bacterium]
MKKILVAGLINIETSAKIEEFPIKYTPIDFCFHGVESTISGVGYNMTKGLRTLGDKVELLSVLGDDLYRLAIEKELTELGVSTDHLAYLAKETATSVILYDPSGKRKILLDLKDIQDFDYPEAGVDALIEEADIVVPCNINFSRSILRKAKAMNKLIASDVHVIASVEDDYNKEYMEAADILFFSNENILGKEKEFIREVADTFHNQIIVVGMGAQGALLYQSTTGELQEFAAVTTREIVSTVGAGDALFTAFLHFYSNGCTPEEALQNAIVFASYKIGEKGAAAGFLSEAKLLELKKSLNLQ